MKIDGRTKCLGVIGNPITHSLSPAIHNYLIEKMNLPYVYLAFPVDKNRGATFLEAAKEIPIYGLNVTMPLKEILFTQVSVRDSRALAVQGVNTLVLNQRGLYDGYNTDGEGFIGSIPTTHTITPNSQLLILGGGAAARSIAISAKQRGGQVTFMVRDIEKAKRIMDDSLEHTNPGGKECSFIPWNNKLADTPVDILVNATPMGMTGERKFLDFSVLKHLEKKTLVYDLIYHPWETHLLQKARQAGFPVQNGWEMLVRQAVLSFQLFTGQQVPDTLLYKIVSRDFQSLL